MLLQVLDGLDMFGLLHLYDRNAAGCYQINLFLDGEWKARSISLFSLQFFLQSKTLLFGTAQDFESETDFIDG